MHKSGFINIIGNPNVGKSTLMNCFMGEKFSIITSKAQTTRHRILGIVNGEDFQLVFSDTPGILKPSYELQDSMMDFVKNALEDADIIIYMLEIGETSIKNSQVHKKILNANVPTFILLNKIDLSDQKNLEDQRMSRNKDEMITLLLKEQENVIRVFLKGLHVSIQYRTI